MKGIRIAASARLGLLLQPLNYYLDQCWWYLGDSGVLLPARHAARDMQRLSKRELERLSEESARDYGELDKWVDDTSGFSVGKPGFFSRDGNRVSLFDTTHFASDAQECPYAAFGEATLDYSRVARPDKLPPEICLMARDVDAAFTELFFREDWMFDVIWAAARAQPEWQVEEI